MAVLQGALIIDKLKNLTQTIQHEDIQPIINEILILVSMKTGRHSDNVDTMHMNRLNTLVDLSKNPEHQPVAEWLLTDFFAQNDRDRKQKNSARSPHLSDEPKARATQQWRSSLERVTAELQEANAKSTELIAHCMADPIRKYFAVHCHEWDFDVFEFAALCTDNGASAFMALTTFLILPISEQLKLDSNAVTTYFHEIEQSYKTADAVVYHNSLHAADVLFNMWFFIQSTYFEESVQLSIVAQFAGLMAALVHDGMFYEF